MPTSSEMMKDITRWRREFARPSESDQKVMDDFATFAAVDYVLNLNEGEMTQTLEGSTQEIIEEVLKSESGKQEVRSIREHVNMYLAMRHLFKFHEEDKKGSITVPEINVAHEILFRDVPDCDEIGRIREELVYTVWKNRRHWYPAHEEVKGMFSKLILRHNICMEYLRQLDVDSEDYTACVIKCAARLLFQFVSTHPYMDGNGRMCRLLSNYVLGLIAPFPVAIYHSDESRSTRGDYVNAIVRCREHPEEGPRALAAMLVEGAWHGWKKLIAFMENDDLA